MFDSPRPPVASNAVPVTAFFLILRLIVVCVPCGAGRSDHACLYGSHIALFQEQTIRRTWHNDEWWFSVIDVVGVLSESANPNRYCSDLK